MKTMFFSRRPYALFCLASLACLSWALPASSWAANEVLIKIGHAAPLSGTQARFGLASESAARLAIDDLNAKNVVIGGKAAKFELVSENDAGDAEQAQAVAKKLVRAGVSGVVGHLNSATTLAASSVYHTAGVPQITATATDPRYTQQNMNTTFRVVANDRAIGTALGLYTSQVLKHKRAIVIDNRSVYGRGLADIFATTAANNGTEIVGRLSSHYLNGDRKKIVSLLKTEKPDLVFYGGLDTEAAQILHWVKQYAPQVRVMGGDGICTDALVSLAGKDSTETSLVGSNVICATGGISFAKMPQGEAFATRYRNAYQQEAESYAPFVYDAVMALGTAMQRANSTEPKKIVPALASLNVTGITGALQFTPKGERQNAAVTLFTYKDGKKAALN